MGSCREQVSHISVLAVGFCHAFSSSSEAASLGRADWDQDLQEANPTTKLGRAFNWDRPQLPDATHMPYQLTAERNNQDKKWNANFIFINRSLGAF